jgi:hypothetical protein
MRKLNSAATNDHSKSEDNLLPVPLRDEPGVLRTEIDTANHAVMIDFDPRVISDEGVRQVAEKLAPSATSSIAGRFCASADAPRARRSRNWKRKRRGSTVSGVREPRFSAVL